MTAFAYRAINQSGRVLVGTMEAASPSEVIEHLDRTGYMAISTSEASGAGARKTWRELLTPEPKPADITSFTLDLAMLLKGGVTLDEALAILSQMETKRWLARLIGDLHVELSGGKSFSQVLAAYPDLFPPIYMRMVEVAETSGRLEQALSGIARERQRTEGLRKRLVSAIAYPLFLVVAALGVLCFVLLYVIPQFAVALEGFRDKMKSSTVFVFQLSSFFRDNLEWFVFGAVSVLALALVAKRLSRGRSLWLRLFSRLPVADRIVGYDVTLTFCRSLAILLENGVDISTALRLIRGLMKLPRADGLIDQVMADVRQGKRLSDALARSSLLPPHVVQILRVGEEAGTLASSADRIAGFYEAKLDTALGRVSAVIGPAMMIGVSFLVAWLIISVMTALISVNDLLV